MTALEELRGAKSLNELASLLGYKPKSISYILYKIPDYKKYTIFSISKKNGGERIIKAPVGQLKNLQKNLAKILNECFEEISVKSERTRALSHGFRKDKSIITNAINHRNRRHVFNVDLKDFFPSINFGRVRGFLIKNVHFELDPKVATIIAQIACHDNELPQGSPCSPIISNLIGHLLDVRMANLAKKAKCTYSRYADDLTFSTNRKEFPEIIAIPEKEDGNEWYAGKTLEKEIEKVGFTLNKNKTSMQYRAKRQVVTGLVVNKVINIKREYYKQARSMCHSLFQSDEFYIGSKHVEKSKLSEASTDKKETTAEEAASEKRIKGSMAQLEGILNYISYVKKPHDKRDQKEKRSKPTAMTKLYRKFLFYKYCFSLDRPLIISEGKTDPIYLTCALKQLFSYYAELVQRKEDGFSFQIRFLKLSPKLADILGISGGTGSLLSLIKTYKEYITMFKGNGKKHPVIILVDNDAGSDEIKKFLGEKVLTKPFYHIEENLYVVPIPLSIDGKERMIEELFDKEILDTKIDGKKFNFKIKKLKTKEEYGKIVFAEQVVKVNQNTINFDQFKGIFDRFIEVVENYKSLHASLP